MKERTLGYLGLGKTRDGDFLSSEDIDLLQTLTGYVSVALENAQLYESLEKRALEYQALTDFSENIIESINAGVLACDLEGKVGSWNSAMEKLYGLARNDAVGKSLQAIFPPELLAELPRASDAQSVLSLYKFRLNTPGGQTLIVNLSAVPLVGKGRPRTRPPADFQRPDRAGQSRGPVDSGRETLLHRPAGGRRGARSEHAFGGHHLAGPNG